MFLWAKDESQAYLIIMKQCKIMYPMEYVDKMTAHTCDFSHELAVPILLCRQ